MLTDAQLEEAARQLCALRGVDPDEMIEAPPLNAEMVLRQWPRWQKCRMEIESYLGVQRRESEIKKAVEAVQGESR